MSLYLFFFYVFFLVFLFVMPTLKTRRKTGVNPMQFSKEDNVKSYVGRMYRLISALVFACITLNAFVPQVMVYLVPISYLQIEFLQWIGLALMHIALILIFIAQQNMANSWRVEIDNENKVSLVTHGLFSLSRNPIFFCVIMIFAGLFFIIPNVLSFVILFSGPIVIQVQVRLEEEFLLNKFGDDYKKYQSKVKRWLF